MRLIKEYTARWTSSPFGVATPTVLQISEECPPTKDEFQYAYMLGPKHYPFDGSVLYTREPLAIDEAVRRLMMREQDIYENVYIPELDLSVTHGTHPSEKIPAEYTAEYAEGLSKYPPEGADVSITFKDNTTDEVYPMNFHFTEKFLDKYQSVNRPMTIWETLKALVKADKGVVKVPKPHNVN